MGDRHFNIWIWIVSIFSNVRFVQLKLRVVWNLNLRVLTCPSPTSTMSVCLQRSAAPNDMHDHLCSTRSFQFQPTCSLNWINKSFKKLLTIEIRVEQCWSRTHGWETFQDTAFRHWRVQYGTVKSSRKKCWTSEYNFLTECALPKHTQYTHTMFPQVVPLSCPVTATTTIDPMDWAIPSWGINLSICMLCFHESSLCGSRSRGFFPGILCQVHLFRPQHPRLQSILWVAPGSWWQELKLVVSTVQFAEQNLVLITLLLLVPLLLLLLLLLLQVSVGYVTCSASRHSSPHFCFQVLFQWFFPVAHQRHWIHDLSQGCMRRRAKSPQKETHLRIRWMRPISCTISRGIGN